MDSRRWTQHFPRTLTAIALAATVGFAAWCVLGASADEADPNADALAADPPSTSTVDAEAEASRLEELQGIRAQIEQLQGQLAAVRGRQKDLENELQQVRLELDLQQMEVDEATTAHELAEGRAAAAQAKITELEAALGEIRADLGRRLSGLYRLGSQGYLRLFLALEPGQGKELLPAIRQLRFLVRRDQQTFDRFHRTRDALAEQQDRLVAQREAMSAWRQREAERRDELAALEERHRETIRRVSAERRRLAKRTLDLRDKEKKLVQLINSLVDPSAEGLEGAPIQDFQGVLDWPVRGEVTSEFGPRLDPRYRTEVPHNGVDIAAEAGKEVRVIYPGKVLYSSTFEGYGPMVVVHHPGRVFTLYAGLRDLGVAKGDVLSLGDVVGHATETIYFEVRVENQPENPRQWLR